MIKLDSSVQVGLSKIQPSIVCDLSLHLGAYLGLTPHEAHTEGLDSYNVACCRVVLLVTITEKIKSFITVY